MQRLTGWLGVLLLFGAGIGLAQMQQIRRGGGGTGTNTWDGGSVSQPITAPSIMATQVVGDSLSVTGWVANVVLVTDGITNAVPSRTGTNVLDLIRNLGTFPAPDLGASGTNIVVDYQFPMLSLSTSTNVNLSSLSYVAGIGCILRVFADGGDVVVNNGITGLKILNASVSFPLTITNGDWGVFSFNGFAAGNTNNAVAFANAH